MQKRAPSLWNVVVIAVFALSCFGLLLFLWLSFGGTVPLRAKGYRFNVVFPQAEQLADQSDVRISGVPVGHVVELGNTASGQTRATIQLDPRYAPAHADVRAILRAKTLLGETYVELSPGSRSAPTIPEGGTLAPGEVAPSVDLDQIYRTLDPRTRVAFQAWMQSAAAGLQGRGMDINEALGTLDPLSADAAKVLGVLQSQNGAVAALVRNTGTVFDALTQRDHQLRTLVTAAGATFSATAAASQALADAFRALPPFEAVSQTALRRLDRFATDTSPLLTQLRPAEVALAPALASLRSLSPGLRSLLVGLGPLTRASARGLPALDGVLGQLAPLLGQLSPVLRNLNPVLGYGGQYLPELEAFFANSAASTEAHNNSADVPTGPQLHYLRTTNPLGPESLAVAPQRPGSNRADAYQLPGAFNGLVTGLPVLSPSSCSNPTPTFSGPANSQVSSGILDLIAQIAVAVPAGSGGSVPAPPCRAAAAQPFAGAGGLYPHVLAAGH